MDEKVSREQYRLRTYGGPAGRPTQSSHLPSASDTSAEPGLSISTDRAIIQFDADAFYGELIVLSDEVTARLLHAQLLLRSTLVLMEVFRCEQPRSRKAATLASEASHLVSERFFWPTVHAMKTNICASHEKTEGPDKFMACSCHPEVPHCDMQSGSQTPWCHQAAGNNRYTPCLQLL